MVSYVPGSNGPVLVLGDKAIGDQRCQDLFDLVFELSGALRSFFAPAEGFSETFEVCLADDLPSFKRLLQLLELLCVLKNRPGRAITTTKRRARCRCNARRPDRRSRFDCLSRSSHTQLVEAAGELFLGIFDCVCDLLQFPNLAILSLVYSLSNLGQFLESPFLRICRGLPGTG